MAGGDHPFHDVMKGCGWFRSRYFVPRQFAGAGTPWPEGPNRRVPHVSHLRMRGVDSLTRNVFAIILQVGAPAKEPAP